MEQDVPSEQTFYVYDGSTLLGEVAAGSLEPTPVAKAAYTWGADGLIPGTLAGGVCDTISARWDVLSRASLYYG